MSDWYRVQLKCQAHGNVLSHHLMVEADGDSEAHHIAESIIDPSKTAIHEVSFETEGG